MTLISCFLVAMSISVLMVPILNRIATPLGLVDKPNERKVHLENIPRIGGVAIVFGALIPILIWVELSKEIQAYVYGSICILLFGIWDDRKEINYKLKFLGQLISISIFVIYGGVYIEWLPFQGISSVPVWLSLFLTFFALLGITNAVNLVDGLDGLAGGTSLLSFGAIALLAYLSGDTGLVMLTLAICGSIFGFLRYNTHPASIFMGDTGSQFLGFSIGVAAVLLTQRTNTALSPILPLILLGLPILDTLTVMSRRILKGKSPFSADKNHFHHRLMNLGFQHYEAVIIIYLVQISLIISAFLMMYQSDLSLMVFFILFCLGFNGVFKYAEHRSWQYRTSAFKAFFNPVFDLNSLRTYKKRLTKMIRPFLFMTVSVYLFVCVWEARALEGIIYLYLGMLALSLYLLFMSVSKDHFWLSRMVWYAAFGLAVYCSAETGFIDTIWVKMYMASLLMVILLSFQLENNDGLKVNPLDIIMLIALGTMISINLSGDSSEHAANQISQAIIFLYVVELMMAGKRMHRSIVQLALSFIFAVGSVFSLVIIS